MNTKSFESLADIAYSAGINRYYSGDSRADMNNFIHWAKEFEDVNKDTDWHEEDYMLAIEALRPLNWASNQYFRFFLDRRPLFAQKFADFSFLCAKI